MIPGRTRESEQHQDAEPQDAERASKRQLHAPASPHVMDNLDQLRRRVRASIILSHNPGSPRASLTPRLVATGSTIATNRTWPCARAWPESYVGIGPTSKCDSHECFKAENQDAGQTRSTPHALVAFLLLIGRRDVRPGGSRSASPPQHTGNHFLRIHRRQIGFRQIDVAGHGHRRRRVPPLRTHFVKALLGQLEDVGPSPSSGHALTRWGENDAWLNRARDARHRSGTARFQHVADGQPRWTLGIRGQRRHHSMHERQKHGFERQVVAFEIQ